MNGSHQGFVLPVGMIFLIILSLLSLGAMKDVLLEEKMAGNYIDQQVSFERAESALRSVERIGLHQSLESIEATTGFRDSSSGSLQAPDFGNYDWNDSSNYFTVNAVELGDELSNQEPPVAVIERLHTTQSPKVGKGAPNRELGETYLRVTVKATGHTPSASTTLQSVVKR